MRVAAGSAAPVSCRLQRQNPCPSVAALLHSARYYRMPDAPEGRKQDQTSEKDSALRSGRVEVRVVPKPWGHETIWASTDLYVGKILHIKAGHALSIQYHNVKDETVHLLTGEIVYRVQRGSDPDH